MSGLGTALAALGWLVGLVVLLRWPIATVGAGVALVAWTWDPGGFWLVLLVTLLVSWSRRAFGPEDRFLVRHPQLAVALVAGVVAVLAGGQLAAGALAVLVLALGWSTAVAVVAFGGPGRHRSAPPTPATPTSAPEPAPTTGFLGPGSLRVDVGPCPDCGGLLVATGRTRHDPARGPVFLAEARCTACGRHLVGLGNAATAEGGVTWINPHERREGIA